VYLNRASRTHLRVILVEDAVVDHQPVLVAGPATETGSLCVLHGAK
jgi:hypothetical protein